MGKRAAAAACQFPGISERPRRRKKESPGDVAPGLGSCSSTTTTTPISERKPPDEAAAPGLGGVSSRAGSGTTQAAQIQGGSLKPDPGGKRKRADNNPGGGLRSCPTAAAATTTSHVPLLPTTRRPLSSWGAKRLRTALAGSRWRDWGNLDEGPVGLIAERVLAADVAGYIRFRTVCPAWRRCCAAAPRGVLDDRRFYPRQWIMLRGANETLDAATVPHATRRQFLSTSTGQCIQVDIPELRDHGVVRATTAEGLLVLFFLPCKATREAPIVRLLNPLTRQMAELPAIARDLRDCSSAGLVDDGTICLYFPPQRGRTLAIAKPGDDRWVLLDAGPQLLRPTVYFAGRFYGSTTNAVMTVDMEAAGGPRLVVAAKLAKRVRVMLDSVHLVVNAGDLTLVHCMVRQIPDPGDRCNLVYKRMYMVYRVDLKAGKMRVTRNLGGRAIFMNYCCSLSVSPQVFPFLSADAIYLGYGLFGNGQHGSYHLRDGTTQPYNNVRQKGAFARPWSIADCLAAYVSN